MRNFFYQLSSATARFMYGRNGGDQLNVALLVVYLAMCLLQAAFTQNHSVSMALHLLTLAVAAVVLFRMFSRNLEKRRGENARFLECTAICRVPAGKGKIEITCPKCGQKIIGKS